MRYRVRYTASMAASESRMRSAARPYASTVRAPSAVAVIDSATAEVVCPCSR